MFDKIFNIASSAMSANRLRINTVASNIANAQTTRTEEGGPYKRKDVVMAATDMKVDGFNHALDRATLKGVAVAGVLEDQSEPQKVYDPGHPDADPNSGVVELPNINVVTEMVNMISASNSYKAAAEVASVTKEMSQALRQLASRF